MSSFRFFLMFASAIFLLIGCDTPGEGGYNTGGGNDAFSSYDVKFSDVGVVSYDALGVDSILYRQVWEEDLGEDPEDPPLDPDFVGWRETQLCKVNKDCTDDDGDPITDLVGCDTTSHRCVHAPPQGCYTLRVSGEVYGDPENIDGVFPDPSIEPWQSCPSGNCQNFSYCPGLRWDYFNVLTQAGNWAADWDSCPQGSFDDTVFTDGVMPEDVGCQPICFGSSEYDPPYKKVFQWQCSLFYLPD